MVGFIGILGDWRSHQSEFSLEKAVNELGGDASIGTKIAIIDPLSGAIAAGSDRGLVLGLGLSNSAVSTLHGAQTAHHSGREIIAIFCGRLLNRPELVQDLAIQPGGLPSPSDADLLAAAYRRWGADGLARIEGSYAVVIVDASIRKLFIATDHFGTRPLFFGLLNGQVVFGTSLRALTALVSNRPKLDARMVRCYVTGTSGPPDRSMVSGIKRLLPAQVGSLSYADGKPTASSNAFDVSTYWRSRGRGGAASIPLRQALTMIRDTLYASTRRCIEGAESPVIGLTGGIHSSSVLLALRHACGSNVSIPALQLVRPAGVPAVAPHADLAARLAGAAIRRFEMSPVIGQDIEAMACVLNDPIIDVESCVTYKLLREARSLGHSTVLTGAGATSGLGSGLQSWSSRLAEHLVAGEALAGLRYAWSLRKIARPRLLSHAAIKMAWPAVEAARAPLAGLPSYFEDPSDTSNALMTPDIPAYMAHRHQMELEAASNFASALAIEHSAPLASVALAEAANSAWALKLERNGRASGGLLIAAMRGILPDAILNEPVAASSSIQSDFEILAQNPDWVWAKLHDDFVGDLPLQAQILRESWLLMLKGKAVYDPIVWRWINLATWARAHRVSFS